MSNILIERIEDSLGSTPVNIARLSGGSVAEVYRAELTDGTQLAVKLDRHKSSGLEIEGSMLKYLATKSNLPVPEVFYSDNRLLVMELLPGKSRYSNKAQANAAEIMAQLHSVSYPNYGFDYDTLIGGLHQPNTWTDSWIPFFRNQRLIYMAKQAQKHGRLPSRTFSRIEKFAETLEDYLEEPTHPSLLHGDAWAGNILAVGDQITGFLDPAIYYGHAEIELAFTTLFGTFGPSFFERYREIGKLRPGFMEVRRDIYNLYPLLVHVRLFGGGYVEQVENTLRRFGV